MAVTVGAAQILTSGDIDKNLEIVIRRLEEAKELGVQILAFPEGTLFGYTNDPEYWRERKVEEFARAEREIQEVCRRLGVAAVVGTASKAPARPGAPPNWRNEVVAIDENGVMKARYGKTFLAGEKWCEPYPGPLLVTTLAGVACTFIICHDVRYPELVRLPVLLGARLCIFCSNESGLIEERKLSAYRAMPIARATENGIFLVMSNAPADPDRMRSPGQSHGNSKVVHPDGNVLVEAGYFEQKIVWATISIEEANGGCPLRARDAQTPLGAWWRSGMRLVERV